MTDSLQRLNLSEIMPLNLTGKRPKWRNCTTLVHESDGIYGVHSHIPIRVKVIVTIALSRLVAEIFACDTQTTDGQRVSLL